MIAALPARYREVVILCDLEGHTYEAAAAALECAVGTHALTAPSGLHAY